MRRRPRACHEAAEWSKGISGQTPDKVEMRDGRLKPFIQERIAVLFPHLLAKRFVDIGKCMDIGRVSRAQYNVIYPPVGSIAELKADFLTFFCGAYNRCIWRDSELCCDPRLHPWGD